MCVCVCVRVRVCVCAACVAQGPEGVGGGRSGGWQWRKGKKEEEEEGTWTDGLSRWMVVMVRRSARCLSACPLYSCSLYHHNVFFFRFRRRSTWSDSFMPRVANDSVCGTPCQIIMLGRRDALNLCCVYPILAISTGADQTNPTPLESRAPFPPIRDCQHPPGTFKHREILQCLSRPCYNGSLNISGGRHHTFLGDVALIASTSLPEQDNVRGYTFINSCESLHERWLRS